MSPPPNCWQSRHSPHPGEKTGPENFPRWSHDWTHRRRFMFRRFLVVFGAFFFLLIAAVTAGLVLALGLPQAGFNRPGALLLVACGIPLAFFALVGSLGGLVFRRFGTPLADIMSAADAVAEGDLSVRLKEGSPGEMGRLASRFNHMVAGLSRSEQQRRNMTADVAHELRTPLHIIQGNLEGILDGVYEPSPEHISATLEETRLLSRLVSDLQTLSLAEAGQLPLHKIHVTAADLLSDVVASFAGQAAEQGVDLRVEIAEHSPPPELYADPDRLDQVISNLVANAIRYTPPGGRILLRALAIPGGTRLVVEDSGTGIPEEDLPYIFDRFWRGDRSRTRGGGVGSGLGLAIAKQVVQAHGGQIGVESRLGEGTMFMIDLKSAE